MAMNLLQLKQTIKKLTPEQREKLSSWLQDLITTKEKQQNHSDHKTYRKESVRCGKEGCRCSTGKLHGPYWYAYWSEDGATRSQYIGKKLPEGIRVD